MEVPQLSLHAPNLCWLQSNRVHSSQAHKSSRNVCTSKRQQFVYASVCQLIRESNYQLTGAARFICFSVGLFDLCCCCSAPKVDHKSYFYTHTHKQLLRSHKFPAEWQTLALISLDIHHKDTSIYFYF